MTRQTLDPRDFAERLDRGFGAEPPHASIEDDLRQGKRRLLRRRASVALGGLAAAAVVSGAVTLLPATGVDRSRDLAPAAGGAAAEELSRADVLDRCTTGENALFIDGSGSLEEQRAVALLGEAPRVVTWAAVENRTQATLLSEDGEYWGDCQFRNAPEDGVKNVISVYPTDVSFPRHVVSGVRAYEPHDESDPRLSGTATGPVPQFDVGCVVQQPEETAAWDREAAACPSYTMTWNDRRPAEVAAVRVTTPDGESSRADVTGGYLSFAYTGDMTPEIAERVAVGDAPGAARVTFFDKDGNVLVDDRHPGQLPQDGSISIANFPSLAFWLR